MFGKHAAAVGSCVAFSVIGGQYPARAAASQAHGRRQALPAATRGAAWRAPEAVAHRGGRRYCSRQSRLKELQMHQRAPVRVAGLLLSAFAATACAKKQEQAVAPPVPPTVTVTAADFAFNAPDTIPAGVVKVRLVN